jgi:hypothetical protein
VPPKTPEPTPAISTQAIQARLQQLAGNNAGLTPTQLPTLIHQLRHNLLAGADQVAKRLQQNIQAQASFKPDRLFRETIRIAIAASSAPAILLAAARRPLQPRLHRYPCPTDQQRCLHTATTLAATATTCFPAPCSWPWLSPGAEWTSFLTMGGAGIANPPTTLSWRALPRSLPVPWALGC